MERGVALVVPGLCGPSPDAPLGDLLPRRPAALERLLARARVAAAADDSDATVCAFFDLDCAPGAPPPVAPLTWLADTGQPAPAYVLRADPVHVRADRSCLRLYDSATFAIDALEAAALVASFNDHFHARGWRLEAPVAQRWYLFPLEVPEITTVAPARVAGADLDGCLPAGRDAAQWHALLNEVQMLFHEHPVNRAREARGVVPVNSLWPWGGGVHPAWVRARVAQVWTEQPLATGLARLAGIPRQPLTFPAPELRGALAPGDNLFILDALEGSARHADLEAWAAVLMRLEQDWFEPLLGLLEDGHLGRLAILPVNGVRFAVTRHGLRRFWKGVRPLAESCSRG